MMIHQEVVGGRDSEKWINERTLRVIGRRLGRSLIDGAVIVIIGS